MSKEKSRHLLDEKNMAIICGRKPDDKLGHTRRTFTPIEDKANTSPCTELYQTSQTVAKSDEKLMDKLTPFTIPIIASLAEQGLAFPKALPTWLLKDKITRGKYGHSVWQGFPFGFPVNPRHCTGVIGRGGLGKWGPNFAADALVSKRRETDGNER